MHSAWDATGRPDAKVLDEAGHRRTKSAAGLLTKDSVRKCGTEVVVGKIPTQDGQTRAVIRLDEGITAAL
jgi:hypothetical protein